MQAVSVLRRVLLVARAPSFAPVASTSTARGFATVSESTVPTPTAASLAPPPSRPAPHPSKKTVYVVPAPVDRPKAARYSPKSSRVAGRRPNLHPSKALSATEAGVKSEVGELKIYLPSVFMRLVRNTGAHADDPYTATFRTDLRLTKPDISNYLKNVYGLAITSIRTMNYISKMKRNPIGGGYSRAGGTKNYKKVLVTLTEPFWYPPERSREWVNEHFQRDMMEEMRDRKMLKIGDGGKYGVSAQRYRGAHKSRADVERLAALVATGGASDTPSDGKAAIRKPAGLRKQRNVIRSRAERLSESKTKIEQEMDRLREAGW